MNRERPSLREMLDAITPDNRHQEEDTGPAVGNEEWKTPNQFRKSAMSFKDFTIEKITTQLRLTVGNQNLFNQVQPVELPGHFLAWLRESSQLAMAVNTEKGRSEFIIAPLLFEVYRRLEGRVSLFSGVDLTIDPAQGLNGMCDYVFSLSDNQHYLTAPIITIVEAKNENIKDGIPQCIAEMYAARLFNARQERHFPRIYGVVTTGSSWKFLYLEQNSVMLDRQEYFIDQPGLIAGILLSIFESVLPVSVTQS